MAGKILDNNPYTIESPYKLKIQYSPDIEWDWGSYSYPSGEESSFAWSNAYMPVKDVDGELTPNHVWQRTKVGDGNWGLPQRLNDLIEKIEVNVKETTSGDEYTLATVLSSGVSLESNPFKLLQTDPTAEAPILIEGKVIKHSSVEGNKHVPAGGSNGQVLKTDGSGNYLWETLSTIAETDPIFTAWDKSTGISITESQISDLGSYIETETDPIFTAWDKDYEDLTNHPDTLIPRDGSPVSLEVKNNGTKIKGGSTYLLRVEDVGSNTIFNVSPEGNVTLDNDGTVGQELLLIMNGYTNRIALNGGTGQESEILDNKGNSLFFGTTSNNYIKIARSSGTSLFGIGADPENIDSEGWLFQVGQMLFDGNQLLTDQQSAIASISGTASGADAVVINELKAQVNDLLAKLRTHGLIAT